ncbi:unnamed protein product, partial [Musa hybrid cultivar]
GTQAEPSAHTGKMTLDEADTVVIGVSCPENLPTIGRSQSLSAHLPSIYLSDLKHYVTSLSAFITKRM